MIENEDQKSGYFDLARAFAEAYEAVKFERHSAATKAKWADPFIRARIRARSILARANPEIREKMSQAIRQFYASPQGERLRRQISKRMTGKFAGERNPLYGVRGPAHPNYGRKLSEKHKRATGNAQRGEKNHGSFITNEIAWEIKCDILNNPDESLMSIGRRWTRRLGREMTNVVFSCNGGAYHDSDEEPLTYPIRPVGRRHKVRRGEEHLRALVTNEEAWAIKLEIRDSSDTLAEITRRWTRRLGRAIGSVVNNCNNGAYRDFDKEPLIYPLRPKMSRSEAVKYANHCRWRTTSNDNEVTTSSNSN